MKPEGQVIDDVTGLNPVRVRSVSAPATIEELAEAVAGSSGPVSIGGARLSMGGQTSSPGSLHVDVTRLDRILEFSGEGRTIRVQAGARWSAIQRFIDPHDLSVSAMPDFANATVGGSLSANVHGDHAVQGILPSARSLTVVLAHGEVRRAGPADDPDLFYGIIGGYGGLGIIVEAELALVQNRRLQRVAATLPVAGYVEHVRSMRRDPRGIVLHAAALSSPRFETVRAATWFPTALPATRTRRLRPDGAAGGFSVRELFNTPVRWRNHEAGRGFDWKRSDGRTAAGLSEYAVPVERFEEFSAAMGEILRRYEVDVVEVTVRCAPPDSGSLLAWAREESFVHRIHYRHDVSGRAKETVAVWTRELIETALRCGGTFLLAAPVHATPDQFHRGYPKARQFFALKRWLDPRFRLRNALWDNYYAHFLDDGKSRLNPSPDSAFHTVFSDAVSRDAFYRYLQNVYHRHPEDRVQEIISSGCVHHAGDEAIYRHVARSIPGIAPAPRTRRRARAALAKQKREIVRQTLELLGGRNPIRGFVEIGTGGRYAGALRRRARIEGPVFLIDDVAPSRGLRDIVERRSLRQPGRFLPLRDYAPLVAYDIPDSSVDVVVCCAGLHHVPAGRRDGFVRSLWRILRPGGLLVLREHDAGTPAMKTLVSLAHTVDNAGMGVPWEVNREERRHFESVEETSRYLAARGFRDAGKRLVMANDPTDNVLMAFVRTDAMSRRALATAGH